MNVTGKLLDEFLRMEFDILRLGLVSACKIRFYSVHNVWTLDNRTYVAVYIRPVGCMLLRRM